MLLNAALTLCLPQLLLLLSMVLLFYIIRSLLCAAQTATRIYVVMEYIRGCTLKALMRAHRARGLPIAALRFWFAEVRLISNCCYYRSACYYRIEML
jgi:hypothetical protein